MRTATVLAWMAPLITQGKSVGVVGCKDPEKVIQVLDECGVQAVAEPMAFNNQVPLGEEPVIEGYLFKLKEQPALYCFKCGSVPVETGLGVYECKPCKTLLTPHLDREGNYGVDSTPVKPFNPLKR